MLIASKENAENPGESQARVRRETSMGASMDTISTSSLWEPTLENGDPEAAPPRTTAKADSIIR